MKLYEWRYNADVQTDIQPIPLGVDEFNHSGHFFVEEIKKTGIDITTKPDLTKHSSIERGRHLAACLFFLDNQSNRWAINTITGKVMIVRSRKMMTKSKNFTGSFEPSKSEPTSDM